MEAQSFIVYKTNFINIDTQVSFIDDLRNTNIFHGGLGLLTYNGLKKPTFNAYQLLNKLQGEIISTGNKHIITKNSNIIRILIHNYDENNAQLYRKQKALLCNQSYLSFKNIISYNFKRLITLSLKVDSGKYRVRVKTLNENSGCIFSQWISMGSPFKMDEEELNFLKSRENIDIKISLTSITNYLTIEEVLLNNEIKLIEIEKIPPAIS